MIGRMPEKRKGSVERNRNVKNAFEQLRELLQLPKGTQATILLEARLEIESLPY